MGEFEEQQHTEVLQVVVLGKPVVAPHSAVVPELLNDAIGFY